MAFEYKSQVLSAPLLKTVRRYYEAFLLKGGGVREGMDGTEFDSYRIQEILSMG